MAKRAQPGSVAHCPYCEASLPKVAVECPTCRFPLTMAAAEGGFRAPRVSGTSSTATPTGHAVSSMAQHPGTERARVHGSRAHRMRITAWLLGVSAVLLALAGIGAALSAASPDAASDREATTLLLTALHRATDNPEYRREVTITSLAPSQASIRPSELSIDQSAQLWFAASKSTSGSCYFVVAELPKGTPVGGGTLGRDEPCTAAEVRLRSEPRLTKTQP